MKIVLEHLTKRFPNQNRKIKTEVVAVNDFTFEIPDGKLIGLLGPSGCGKSTMLNMICGLEKPTEGRIYFGEDDVTELPPEKRGVGMVFQSYALYPHLTVRQNIMFPLENLKGKEKMTREEMIKKAEEAAELVQIGRLLDRKPGEMSGGQQQRVAIARALVKRPKVLLLDEPLSNLDARLRLQTREEIRRIQRETGITTVFVTHDQEEAMSISDRIVVMETGVLQQIGKPQDVYDDPVNLFVAKFLGTPPINVFEGSIRDGQLFIGEERIFAIEPEAMPESAEKPELTGTKSTEQTGTKKKTAADSSFKDQPVSVAVRPEGFALDENGPLTCGLVAVERMGRDTSVVCTNPAFTGKEIRAIVPSESAIDHDAENVRFSLKPFKTCLFDKETGLRIRYRVKSEDKNA